MALHAEKFFTQQLDLTDGTVICDIYYATPRPDTPLRLRIGFSRTIRAGEYDGLLLQILHADQGAVLDSVLRTFAAHDTFRSRDAAIDRHPGYDGYAELRDWNQRDEPPWQGAATTKLRCQRPFVIPGGGQMSLALMADSMGSDQHFGIAQSDHASD